MAFSSGFRVLLLHGSAFGLGALVATSCLEPNLPVVAYRCNPRQANNCPNNYFCCSDDASAAGGGLPAYAGRQGSATPFFSGFNNALSTSGMCVDTDTVGAAGLLDPGAEGCPVPCNPNWDRGDLDSICGELAVCCQTVELGLKDCVQSGSTWRPVTGGDIGSLTNWSPGEHDTHQDPGGIGCLQYAGGQENNDYRDCLDHLTAADQRGFCVALAPGETCGTFRPEYVDPCECINQGFCPPPF